MIALFFMELLKRFRPRGCYFFPEALYRVVQRKQRNLLFE